MIEQLLPAGVVAVEAFDSRKSSLMRFQRCLSRMSRSNRWSVHNFRQPDRESRVLAGLALDRDVSAHHLTETPTDPARDRSFFLRLLLENPFAAQHMLAQRVVDGRIAQQGRHQHCSKAC